MAERKWTDKQKSAIETRDRTLLVSAAAGSGKTATLTERIIQSLMDENNPISVENLLVVTFTNAAASELRTKISAALENAVRENPENKRLERQLFMLPQAKIRTIDSFLGDVLRANADKVCVPFNYRIADVAECHLIAESILEGLIEAVYAGEEPEIASPEEFEALADCLTDSKRADELSEAFRLLYEKCESAEDGVELVKRLSELYNLKNYGGLEKTPHNAYLISYARNMMKHYIDVARELLPTFGDGKGGKEFYECALDDIALMESVCSPDDYETVRERVLGFSLRRRPSLTKDSNYSMQIFCTMRNDLKNDVAKKLTPLFGYTKEAFEQLLSHLYEKCLTLYRFLSRFDSLFVREKLRRSALSYSDVERFAYLCLVQDGKRTEVAENLTRSFEAIYIDEYQDVNALQNSVFEAISRKDNRFMVGDIKQSIYGFRHARPQIFADMKKSFAPLSEAKGNEASSIFMSDNFRCDKAVVDFVNSVFDKAFSLVGDSIGYVSEDRLIYSKVYDTEPQYYTPEICMLEKKSDDEESDEDGTDNEKAPLVVALKIKELLNEGKLADGRSVAPSDIAIILRNAKGKDHLYAAALEKVGIPVKISGAKSFFLSSEVLLALCLLNSVDNPRRDIYLAGLMCSPLWGFTPEELCLIRKEDTDSCLYDSLIGYTKAHPEFSKGEKFLSELHKYRAIAEGLACDELLFRLYHETGLLALASESGGKENLMILYDYSRDFEGGEFKGLYNFIHFINSLIDKRTTFDDTRESSDESAVRIVTCHASKGLEYPIVFMVNAGAPFMNKDRKDRLAFNAEMGIALRLRTPSGLSVVNNPIFDIINRYNFEKYMEEELRVLYVALTRARERLFIVGTSPKKDTEGYLEELNYIRETLSPYSMRKIRSYLEIILATTGKKPLTIDEFVNISLQSDMETDFAEREERTVTHTEELSDELIERFGFEYPNKALTRLPEKMSVSKTSPTVLDYAEEGVVDLEEEAEDGRAYLPKFISGSAAEESARRGIATHYFMQFCDLESFLRDGAERELSRLVSEGYISEKDGKRVRLSELEGFRKSDLFSEMLHAASLHRELRFNTRIPAKHFTTEPELLSAYEGREILVQGVIDCIIISSDGKIGLYDYKTDRLSKEELEDREKGRERLKNKHKTQLSYYALAVEKMFGRKPDRVGIYSLHLGELILIDEDDLN